MIPSDPIELGLVASLNHPGGNLTGVAYTEIIIEVLCRSYVQNGEGIWQRKKERVPPTLTMVNEGEDAFVVADGVTIAKCGRPGTAHAGTWISLEPGWTVSFNKNQSELLVKYEVVRAH